MPQIRTVSMALKEADFDSGSSNIYCRIFFAEQFANLRGACQFDASGGKSGSAFLKTKDDRFICKEISRLEMDALTKFAPAYFEYTKKAFQGQVRPLSDEAGNKS